MVRAVIDANWSGGNDAFGVFARIADHTDLVGQQGQICHRGRQVQRELGLDPAELARLPDAQLLEASQSMLHHHPASVTLSWSSSSSAVAKRHGATLARPLSGRYSSAKSASRNICPRNDASRP